MFAPFIKKYFGWGTVGGAGHARFGFGHSRARTQVARARQAD